MLKQTLTILWETMRKTKTRHHVLTLEVSCVDDIVFAVHDVAGAEQVEETALKESFASTIFFVLTQKSLAGGAKSWLAERLVCGFSASTIVLLDNLLVSETFSFDDVNLCNLSLFELPKHFKPPFQWKRLVIAILLAGLGVGLLSLAIGVQMQKDHEIRELRFRLQQAAVERRRQISEIAVLENRLSNEEKQIEELHYRLTQAVNRAGAAEERIRHLKMQENTWKDSLAKWSKLLRVNANFSWEVCRVDFASWLAKMSGCFCFFCAGHNKSNRAKGGSHAPNAP